MLACPVFALAQAAGPPKNGEQPRTISEKKDLGSLLDLALANSPSTRAAWFHAKAASGAITQARAAYYPKIAASFEGGKDKWYTPAANGVDNFTRVQATTVLTIEYLLLDFGRRDADVKRTLALFEAAGLGYERKLQQTVFDVQRAYSIHEAALWRLEATEARLAAVRTLAETVERELTAGLSAVPESLEARKKVLEAEYELESAKMLVRTTLGVLCTACGLPANTRLQLASATTPPPTSGLRENADKLIAQALASRPDLAARSADLRAREAATKRARADFFPEIKLEGKYGYSAFGYEAKAGNSGGTYSEDLNGYGGFLVAKWDLFDGFERRGRLKQRAEEENQAREELEKERLDVTLDVWTASNEVQSAARRVDFAESLVASTKEIYESTRAAYLTGIADVSEYSKSTGELAHARSVRANAVAEYSISLASLVFAIGSPVPASVKERKRPARIERIAKPLAR